MKGLHFLGVAACVAWAGCGGSSGSPQAGVRPDLTDDGWEVALPQEQGLALERLVELERQIAEGRYARP
ncbi:MAG TPA: hypothetical protein VEY30_11780, partial [Myxococcaceae bacterium]|nr:hypothetical protein [Myxococcaceae bacterium]